MEKIIIFKGEGVTIFAMEGRINLKKQKDVKVADDTCPAPFLIKEIQISFISCIIEFALHACGSLWALLFHSWLRLSPTPLLFCFFNTHCLISCPVCSPPLPVHSENYSSQNVRYSFIPVRLWQVSGNFSFVSFASFSAMWSFPGFQPREICLLLCLWLLAL